MIFLPTENLIYKTKLKEDEIIRRLADLIKPEKIKFNLFGSGTTRPYEGQIKGHTFKIKRNINYRDSFLPRISGKIQPGIDETTIEVKMRLHIIIFVFLCIWFGVFGLGCVFFTIKAITHSEINPEMIISFGMILLAYVLAMIGFTYESAKSKKDLQLLFEAGLYEN